MTSKSKYRLTLYASTNMQNMRNNATELSDRIFSDELKDLKTLHYKYFPDEAIEELGLELELIEHLIEDYVSQIVRSNMAFVDFLNKLQISKDSGSLINYTSLRELAHKNLGVARNLRIKDAEKLLYKIMTEDDLDYIFLCVEGLFACVTLLRPQVAFDTLRLIKVKNSF